MKVGDRVKVISTNICFANENMGKTGTITGRQDSDHWYVRFDNGMEDYGRESELELVKKDLEHLSEKDIIVNKDGDEREVLGVCGRAIFASQCNDFNVGNSICTAEELKKLGYKLKGQEEVDDKTQEAIDLLKENGYKIVKE